MIILHFHLLPQLKNELFHYFTSVNTSSDSSFFASIQSLVLIVSLTSVFLADTNGMIQKMGPMLESMVAMPIRDHHLQTEVHSGKRQVQITQMPLQSRQQLLVRHMRLQTSPKRKTRTRRIILLTMRLSINRKRRRRSQKWKTLTLKSRILRR